MPNEQKKCCKKCLEDNQHGCNGTCPCHTPTEEKIKIVPSPRLDWCGACKKEHGYDCPLDTPTVSKWEEIEKIDIEELGKYVHEYKDGKPWTSSIDPVLASRQVAEKVNEIIDSLSSLKQKLEARK